MPANVLAEIYFPTHVIVLVFVDSVEIKGLLVDEKLGAANVDGADSHW